MRLDLSQNKNTVEDFIGNSVIIWNWFQIQKLVSQCYIFFTFYPSNLDGYIGSKSSYFGNMLEELKYHQLLFLLQLSVVKLFCQLTSVIELNIFPKIPGGSF